METLAKKTKPSISSIVPQPVTKPGSPVTITVPTGTLAFPVLFQSNIKGLNHELWIRENLPAIKKYLLTNGGCLFRNFNIDNADSFRSTFGLLVDNPIEYKERTSPRTEVGKNVYTSTDYPADQVINMHNESSYSNNWATKIAFYCATAALTAGETPIADVRNVLRLLKAETVNVFKQRGILYVRNMVKGIGLAWQEVYQTNIREEVEALCNKRGMDYQWWGDDNLRVSWKRPAFQIHPETGEELWFNHAYFYQKSALTERYDKAFSKEEIPFAAYFGDGTDISHEIINEIDEAFSKSTISFPWQKGDLLVLDNMQIAHGRNHFTGERKILVAMGDPIDTKTKVIRSNDEDNTSLSRDTKTIDTINRDFYGRIKFPYRPQALSKLDDNDFWTRMIYQELGVTSNSFPMSDAKIWVAGCGSNQALITALRFPNAKVIGSDLSPQSLAVCEKNAKALDVKNVELRNESINDITYIGEFDMVICTGVIHHNHAPHETLKKLATALRKNGIMELMVYNRYHRIMTTAFQKAARAMAKTTSNYQYEPELLIARKIVDSYDYDNLMTQFLEKYKTAGIEEFADSLIQPVEHSYTVESLQQIAVDAGLTIAAPCIDHFSAAAGQINWNVRFNDKDLQQRYQGLQDLERWQITNLLNLESSPMLWFFMTRLDADFRIKSETQLCGDFLEGIYKHCNTTRRLYVKDDQDNFSAFDNRGQFPGTPGDQLALRVYHAIDGTTPMKAVLDKLNVPADFHVVNDLRINLATSAFPFLVRTDLVK
jgi:2-polyprenyl-3-methyl-5-hydroxy-6-metoxy-1,4-benzoquinol methylase/alpha-ketoglutarate-dependent taurine dioxygenase